MSRGDPAAIQAPREWVVAGFSVTEVTARPRRFAAWSVMLGTLIGCAPKGTPPPTVADSTVTYLDRPRTGYEEPAPAPQDSSEAFDRTYPPGCVRHWFVRVGGVMVGERGDSTVARLGPPTRTSIDSTEDDGGMYQFTRYHYPGLEFDVDSRYGTIERVEASAATISGPAGLRIGMTGSQVRGQLGVDETASGKSKWSWPLCFEDNVSSGGEEEFRLKFSPIDVGRPEQILRSIEVVSYGP